MLNEPGPAAGPRSLSEHHGSVRVPAGGPWIRRLFAFAGPAYLISVGYMDPGNWATDLAGGSRFGYQLLWVLLMSNLMAVLLQTLSARLGVVTGKDLAQACRDWYPRPMVLPLWLLCEIAIVACDLAELLGAALGLKLLFHIPLLLGVFLTGLDVLVLLGLSRMGMRRLEAFIITLVATMGTCFAIEMIMSRPDLSAALAGLLPRNPDGAFTLFGRAPGGGVSVLGLRGESLYVAMGMLGATVMPHNLYLHSSLVQTRVVEGSPEGKRQACRMNFIDSVVALNAAFLVNAAILGLAAAVFFRQGLQSVSRIEDAHRLLAPLLGSSFASTLFAVALLSSGQSSTITGTLAGQIVMEGFLRVRIRPWLRRLVSRTLAIVPAALAIGWGGDAALDSLLILSQVVLSMQLGFAVIPLVSFTGDRAKMGRFANPGWVKVVAWICAALIVGLNVLLVAQVVGGLAAPTSALAWGGRMLMYVAMAALTALLLAVLLAPIMERRFPEMGIISRLPIFRYRSSLHARARLAMQPGAAEALLESLNPGTRIAVALEFGPADATVIERLVSTRLPVDAELILLHVAESAASRYLGPDAGDLESREDLAVLESLAAEFRSRGVRASVRLGNGDPKKELARLTDESRADLLVTGSHGHRMIQDLFLGETTSGLRHLVRCPVLTIPMPRV